MTLVALRRWVVGVSVLAVLLLALALALEPVRGLLAYSWGKVRGGYTLQERLAQYGPDVAGRLRPAFERAGVPYPPHEVAYLSFKDTRRLEVYARASKAQPWRYIKHYPVRAASGELGPKLIEGDRQVPEGQYRAVYLNPNSRFHLSIRLDYPNTFDRRMAATDGRARLGGDIMIHGGAASIGCLAMGDPAAEDLFVLAALVSKERVQVLISPTDFRMVSNRVAPVDRPAWVGSLYEGLRAALAAFPREAAR
ncbi:L,D-transpeptidase family protein [Caldimonas brevitalea]|uniref:Inner membrane protein n=1 Tax=Caldimonas brevitalea TaxID=413882 RepID=A0A0G3BDC2_9BURK|nr:L,D-transpeptidase family protein [Caldimonas brevitalea]AKJ27384.1 inner membrane protein [Caldimonas brevitalea]